MKTLYQDTLKLLKKLLPTLIKIANYATLLLFIISIFLIIFKFDGLLQELGELTAWITIGGLIYILAVKSFARIDLNHRGDLEIFARGNLAHLRSYGFIVFYNALIHSYIEIALYLMDGQSPINTIITTIIPMFIFWLMYITSFANMKTKLSFWQIIQTCGWAIIPLTMTHVILVKQELNPVFIIFTIVGYILFSYELYVPKLKKHGIRHMIIYTLGLIIACVILILNRCYNI